MKVTVHLFARAKDLAGTDSVTINLPEGATIAELRRQLGISVPALARLVEHSMLAVNNDFADEHLSVPLNAEIALLPPVSGG